MRLTNQQRNLLKYTLLEIDPQAKIFLFGSRVDDAKTGGDIDVLIFSTCLDKKQLRQVKWRFYEKFGEQKIDFVLDSGKLDTPFVKLIFPTAVPI
jgi:uncharacterized protein